MKRLAVIVGITLCAALGIGAFVLSGADDTTAAKRPAKTVKTTTAKDAANKITGSTEVKSLPPVPPTKDDDDNDNDNDEAEGYEAKKAFVGVSPRQVKPGERVEVEVRGFAKNTQISITVAGVPTVVTTDKNGKAKLRVAASRVANTYQVVVTGKSSLGTSVTIQKSFKVVAKK